jgi:hypothetical protein
MRNARYIGRGGAPTFALDIRKAAAATPWLGVAESASPHTTFTEEVFP